MSIRDKPSLVSNTLKEKIRYRMLPYYGKKLLSKVLEASLPNLGTN